MEALKNVALAPRSGERLERGLGAKRRAARQPNAASPACRQGRHAPLTYLSPTSGRGEGYRRERFGLIPTRPRLDHVLGGEGDVAVRQPAEVARMDEFLAEPG